MDDVVDNLPAPILFTATPSPRKSRFNRSGALSFAIAFSVHAAVVAAGFYFIVPAKPDFKDAQLVLPKGVAVETPGDGQAGASILTGALASLNLPAAGEARPTESFKPDLGELPPEFLAPQAPTPTSPLNPLQGTSEENWPTIPGTQTTPPRNLNPVPASLQGAAGEQGDAQSTGTQNTGDNSGSNAPAAKPSDGLAEGKGTASAGAGNAAGGGPIGVPDGDPIAAPSNKPPIYPEIALRKGWGGTTVLELQISAEGIVTSVHVKQSSGHEVLDKAAVEPAWKWRFIPATLNGRPLAVTYKRDINFIPPR